MNSIWYGSHQALNHVSLKVKAGEIVSLIGANGAGKSTLMRSILGLVRSNAGQIYFKHLNLLKMTSHEIIQAGISQSPEGRQIFENMTVQDNLLLGAYSQKLSKEELHSRLEEVFTYFPILKERMQQMAMTLSGGEQQMLAIGRALMTKPELLLLDEPSLGLSPLLTQKIFEILVVLNRKGTGDIISRTKCLNGARDITERLCVRIGRNCFSRLVI